MKEFNTTGNCIPSKHYMVDTSEKINEIAKLVDKGKYFTINRARQYGKTTTLGLLEKRLQGDYSVARMSFEGMGSLDFETAESFTWMFMDEMSHCLKDERWLDENVKTFKALNRHISKLSQDKKIVLMIDEVDKICNNQIFLHFLGMLRSKYLDRNEERDTTFHSVILSGVYDIKNIKLKMQVEGVLPIGEKEGKNNSPWNIATDFEVDMSFNPNEISSMLVSYEKEHNIGMDVSVISQEIYNYTNGYPFLVSRLCQHIDVRLDKDWTIEGVRNAVKILLTEKNTLFDDMAKNLENYEVLREFIHGILIEGKNISYTIDDVVINFGIMFGYFKNINNKVAISNRIFEIRITNYFIVLDMRTNKHIEGVLYYDVIKNGRFDMQLTLEKFAKHYQEIYNLKVDKEFLERHGRMVFLSYLKPLINGNGFYHIESELTDYRRMDIVVDYGREQFIIELKRWDGDSKHEEAYEQLLNYMDSKNAEKGYLLTFDFRKAENKVRKAEWVQIQGRRIFDVIV